MLYRKQVVTSKNDIHDEMITTLNFGNASCHLVQNLLFAISKIIIFICSLCLWNLGSHFKWRTNTESFKTNCWENCSYQWFITCVHVPPRGCQMHFLGMRVMPIPFGRHTAENTNYAQVCILNFISCMYLIKRHILKWLLWYVNKEPYIRNFW
jgi:hypothetical protein